VSLRNIRQKYLSEYRETVISFLILIISYIIYLVLTALNLQFEESGRIVLTVLVCQISWSPPLSPLFILCPLFFLPFLPTGDAYSNSDAVGDHIEAGLLVLAGQGRLPGQVHGDCPQHGLLLDRQDWHGDGDPLKG